MYLQILEFALQSKLTLVNFHIFIITKIQNSHRLSLWVSAKMKKTNSLLLNSSGSVMCICNNQFFASNWLFFPLQILVKSIHVLPKNVTTFKKMALTHNHQTRGPQLYQLSYAGGLCHSPDIVETLLKWSYVNKIDQNLWACIKAAILWIVCKLSGNKLMILLKN